MQKKAEEEIYARRSQHRLRLSQMEVGYDVTKEAISEEVARKESRGEEGEEERRRRGEEKGDSAVV